MPSDYPRRPRLLKGALVAYQSQFMGAVPNVIVFQYNPEQLSRTLERRFSEPDFQNLGAVLEDVQRVMGPPVETINLTVELDATDQLEVPEMHPHVVAHGLHPALAALELLLYPKSGQIMFNASLLSRGEAQINKEGEEIPLVLFVWGRHRALPVHLTSFSVTEEAFDRALNPIKAKVALGMRVLSYLELKDTSLGYNAYMASQLQKEGLARLNMITSAEKVLGLLPF